MDDQIPTRAHRARPGGLLALVLALLLVLAGGALPARAQARRASARCGPGRGADPAQPGAGSVAEPRSDGAAGRRAAGRPHARLRPAVAQRGGMALRLSRLPHRAAQRRHRHPPESAAGAKQDGPALAAGRPRRPRDLLAHRRRADDLRAAQLLRGQQRRHRPWSASSPSRPTSSTSFLEPSSQLGVTDLFVSIRRPSTAGCTAGAGRRVHDPLRHDRRVRRGALRHAAHRPHQRRRRAGDREDRIRRPDADPGREGLHGQTNKAVASVTPDVWNNFADPGAGSSFVAHLHAGVGWRKQAHAAGLHLLRAWSRTIAPAPRPPTAASTSSPPTCASTRGASATSTSPYSYTDALQARAVSRIISVLNTPGGQGLMDNYFGPNSNGTGTLTTIGGQYDLSIGKLVSYPVPFSGDGPDLLVSLFGMITHVTSADPGGDVATGNPGHHVERRRQAEVRRRGDVQLAVLAGRFARYDQVDPRHRRHALQLRGGVAAGHPAQRLAGDRSDRHPVLALVQRLEHAGAHRRSARCPTRHQVPDGDMVSLSASMWW